MQNAFSPTPKALCHSSYSSPRQIFPWFWHLQHFGVCNACNGLSASPCCLFLCENIPMTILLFTCPEKLSLIVEEDFTTPLLLHPSWHSSQNYHIADGAKFCCLLKMHSGPLLEFHLHKLWLVDAFFPFISFPLILGYILFLFHFSLPLPAQSEVQLKFLMLLFYAFCICVCSTCIFGYRYT